MWVKKGDWLECTIPSFWQGQTIESLLKEVWCTSKKFAHQLRMEKGIKLNGKEVSWQTTLRENDRLQLCLYHPEPSAILPEYREISVLWEDEHLLIINKEAGIDIHPSEPSQTGTLANAVAFYLQAQGILTKVRHIHRLDRDTSGTILFAKHPLAGATLDRMLEKRQIKRTYVALVHGIVKHKSGTISAPIGRDRHHPTRRRVSKTGAKAVTHYRVLHTFLNDQASLVELSLDTGRTHQIRVHMSYIGHPLVGDVLYGGENTFHRQALHAVKLSFLHPFTKETVSCVAPAGDFPVDIARFYTDAQEKGRR
ncbi:RluA family pseudouridine synthase [Parageobacillus thermoglucosidasius]|uniref:RluA family pseudouridine synthase n=1 Tax=Parageobacillus thermoglucosidasius TaxID=1426 RepID=UPI000E38BDF6|nr:RluA family pseudouridine synthase [Parageobacillus thermoglucosidasius]REK57626.1 MAG: RluA family pseudouridine synthase [Geobacillus sp.]BDG33389.1 pseudouridine synthase [Parageobacillus thermoglucosidasius]GMO01093.1 RluA family pseudouridine synthase [Parageobacillus thermoglucosidasius]